MDNQFYATESELIRCSFCGTTVSTALKICPTCGNDIRPQRRNQITWGAASVFVALMAVAVIISLSSEDSALRSTVQIALNRLDALATSLDPRLAGTPTPESDAVALRLPSPTPMGQSLGAAITLNNNVSSTEDTPALPVEVAATATATPSLTPTEEASPTATDTVAATLTLTNTLNLQSSSTGIRATGTLSEGEIISDVLSLLAPSPTPTAQIDSATATFSPLAYEVRTGDTLFSIAARYDVTLDELLAANGYSGGRAPLLRPGQSLLIPNQLPAESTPLAIAIAATATAVPADTETATPTATETETTTATPTSTATEAATVANRPTATSRATSTRVATLRPTTTATGTATATATATATTTATATDATAVTVIQTAPAAPLTYVVKSGDTPSSIAKLYGVSVNELLAANNLTLNDATRIRPGQSLIIPVTTEQTVLLIATATPGTVQSYVVQSGDTPLSIANRYGVSVDALLAANGLTRADATRMRTGQRLVIPGGVEPTATTIPATATAVPVQSYIVQSGDTPLEIATRFGVSVDALLAANGLTRADATRIRPGQTLLIPGGSQSGSIATPTATKTTAISSSSDSTTSGSTASGSTTLGSTTIRLDAPRLRTPDNGTAVSCNGENRLVWDPVAYIRDSDRYLLHLGYVSGADGSVTWLLAQERIPGAPQWTLDNNLCAFTPQGFNRLWRWYVEVVDPEAGGAVVSAPGETFSFRWE